MQMDSTHKGVFGNSHKKDYEEASHMHELMADYMTSVAKVCNSTPSQLLSTGLY